MSKTVLPNTAMPFDSALGGAIGHCQALAASRIRKDPTVRCRELAGLGSSLNLLATDFFFQILAHSVFKM